MENPGEQGISRGSGLGKGDIPPPKEYQFKPGQSGNPKGRAPGPLVGPLMRAVLEGNTLKGKAMPGGRTVGQFYAEMCIVHAIAGKGAYAQLVADRVDGRARQAPLDLDDVLDAIDDYVIDLAPNDDPPQQADDPPA